MSAEPRKPENGDDTPETVEIIDGGQALTAISRAEIDIA